METDPSDSRGRLRPASEEEREPSNEGEEEDMSNSTLVFLPFFLEECDKIGSGTSRIGVGGTIDMAASFARACEDFLPLVLVGGGYWEEGVGG